MLTSPRQSKGKRKTHGFLVRKMREKKSHSPVLKNRLEKGRKRLTSNA